MSAAADLLEALVRIPSPTGSEADAVAFLHAHATRDRLVVLPDPVGNFICEAGRGERLLLFVGHVDTVPGDLPVRREGTMLRGRGTVDAKGALVTAYEVARRHRDDPRLRMRVVGAIDEEGGSKGVRALARAPEPTWILNGEPSGVHALTLGYKGCVRGRFQLARDGRHAAHPGPSAVEELIAFWQAIAARHHGGEAFGDVRTRLDAVNSCRDPGAARELVSARFQLRLPPGVDPEALGKALERQAREHDIELVVEEAVAGAVAPRRTPLVAAFLGAVRARGGEPRLLHKTGTADFNLLAERHPGVPLAAYGPGDASLDHTPGECLDLAELDEAVEVLDAVVERLAAGGK